MMRHCRQCRADAVGLLGEDRSAEFTTERSWRWRSTTTSKSRKAYQEKVEEERVAKVAAKQDELADAGGREASDIKVLVAVATKGRDGSTSTSATPRSSRSTSSARRARSSSDIAASISIARAAMATRTAWRRSSARSTTAIAVFVAKIGGCPKNDLIKAGIEPVDQFATSSSSSRRSPGSRNISTSVKRGEIEHVQRGDARNPSGRADRGLGGFA